MTTHFRKSLLIAMCLGAAMLAGCGPDAKDIGTLNLVLMPLYALCLFLPALLFDRILKRPMPWHNPSQRRLLIASLAVSVLCVGTGLSQGVSYDEVSIFLLVVCPSCLTLGQLSWLFWRSRTPSRLFGVVQLCLLSLWLILPSIVFTQHVRFDILPVASRAQSVAMLIWGIPGAYGVPTALCFIGIMLYIFKRLKPRQNRVKNT